MSTGPAMGETTPPAVETPADPSHRSFAENFRLDLERDFARGEARVGALWAWVRKETGWVRRLLDRS